eukprot:5741531-Amphidinium_carterae.1
MAKCGGTRWANQARIFKVDSVVSLTRFAIKFADRLCFDRIESLLLETNSPRNLTMCGESNCVVRLVASPSLWWIDGFLTPEANVS